MKKLITLLLSVCMIYSLQAQTYLSKDFEDSTIYSGGWTTYVVTGTTDWYPSALSGNKYAKISNYNAGSNSIAESWMISPNVDISSASSPILKFKTVANFPGAPLKIYLSTNYSGGNPAAATWTDISSQAILDTILTAWGSFLPSGNIDLIPFKSATTSVAFVYTGDSTSGSTWEVDDVVMEEFTTGGTNPYLLFNKDFEDLSITSGGWTTQMIVGTTDWVASSFSGDNFAKITNYSGGSNNPAETWLISPSVDLTNGGTPKLSFRNLARYNGAPLQLLISTNYSGAGDPNNATWTDLSSLAIWDTDLTSWGLFLNSGEIDISTYNGSASVYVAFKYTGSATDGSTWELDDIVLVDSTGGSTTTPTVTIQNIQYTTANPAVSPYMGQIVNTSGVVTAVRPSGHFYLQNGYGPYSGVYVYDNTNTVNVGDSVSLDGLVDEYFDLTEIKNVANFTLISSGNAFMEANVTTFEANSEAYEGCFVSVTATCTDTNLSTNFGMWKVNDGSGDVLVDDQLYSYIPNLNTNYMVRGVVDYGFSEFKILPRNVSDVSQILGTSDYKSSSVRLYPTVTNGNIFIDINEKSNVTFLSTEGKVVHNQALSSNSSINLSHLKSGFYIVKIQTNNDTIVKKIIKK